MSFPIASGMHTGTDTSRAFVDELTGRSLKADEPPPPRALGLEEINELKASANKFFAEGKYSQSIIGYGYAIKQLHHQAVPAGYRKAGDNPHQVASSMKSYAPASRQHVPLMAILYCNRSLAYIKLEKYEKAAADADAATSLDPSLFKAWYRKGLALSEINKFYESTLALKEAIRLDPNSDEAKSLLDEMEYRARSGIPRHTMEDERKSKKKGVFNRMFSKR